VAMSFDAPHQISDLGMFPPHGRHGVRFCRIRSNSP
jgi:hypothetical protein